MSEVPEVLRSERLALVERLSALTPGQWAALSLCAGWTVQDVAAHLAWQPVQGVPSAVVSLVRSRLQVNRMIADNAVRWSRRGPDAIVAQLLRNAESGATPPGVPRVAAVGDAVVHGLDIGRPLGLPPTFSPGAFRLVADFLLSAPRVLSLPLGGSARSRIAGVRLVADGSDWAYGSGPAVHASPEAVLLLLAGRPVAPDELRGPGAAVLRP